IVIDPVMIAKSGDSLLASDALEMFKTKLMPFATVLTPNIPEASILLQREISTAIQMEKATHDMLSFGPKAVVIKGGHLANSQNVSNDCFCIGYPVKLQWFKSIRIHTTNTHGTGCTFSAAIAAYLAR